MHELARAEPLTVAAAPSRVARLDAVQATLSGARSELSRMDALAPGSRYPRMVVEVLRVDERSTGIAAVQSGPDGATLPLARGSSVGVLGRAWVEQSANSEPIRDTGDVRRVEYYSNQGDSRLEGLRHDEAVRAAADALGRALARRVTGLPEPDIEPM